MLALLSMLGVAAGAFYFCVLGDDEIVGTRENEDNMFFDDVPGAHGYRGDFDVESSSRN